MKTIMTVDDSSSLRQMVKLTLESAGYQVIEANDGLDAIQKLSGQDIDLVLTDLNMPVMNGIELTRELRSMEAYRFVPIVLLTTESHVDKKLEGKGVGATGWIVKPFRPQDLLAVVKRVMR